MAFYKKNSMTRTADWKKKHILFGPLLETDFLKAPHGALLVPASLSSTLNKVEQARFIPHPKTFIQDQYEV